MPRGLAPPAPGPASRSDRPPAKRPGRGRGAAPPPEELASAARRRRSRTDRLAHRPPRRRRPQPDTSRARPEPRRQKADDLRTSALLWHRHFSSTSAGAFVTDRDYIDTDVVIVGAGPAGLAAAIRQAAAAGDKRHRGRKGRGDR